MRDFTRLLLSAVFVSSLFAADVIAADRDRQFSSQPVMRGMIPTALQDDANLHDVQFVGKNVGFAVGDRGVIWKTEDASRTWHLQKSPVTCPLRKVCFLTDRIGWVVGSETAPYTRIAYGVILHTQDGGRSWQQLAGRNIQTVKHVPSTQRPTRIPIQPIPESGRVPTGHSNPSPANPRSQRPQPTSPGQFAVRPETQRGIPPGQNGDPSSLRPGLPDGRTGQIVTPVRLPALVYVKFFGLKHGIAVGEATDDFPSGVIKTSDGGRTWQPVIGKRNPGWRAAAFLNPQVGAVAGLHGRTSVVGGGQLLKPAIDDLGLRNIRDIALNRDESGWMVGDGGLVLRTGSGGVVWKSPEKPLSTALRDFVDFHAVATQGDNVWIAGSPGSAIWHSNDAGRSWTKQLTGQTLPIHAMTFVTDRIGWAVGAMGTMLVTADGGRNWNVIRGKDRRVAYMNVHSRHGNLSFPMLTKLSADEGYRSAVLFPTRKDYGPDGPLATAADLQTDEAVTVGGGSALVGGWRLPVALPGLDRDEKRLWKDWNLRAEGRLRDVLLGSLVAQLRTWRPNVVILDRAAESDALTRLLNQAVVEAVKQAGDSTRFVDQSELAGLEPWKVSKVYVRLADGSAGQATIDPHEVLQHLGTVNHVAAQRAGSLFPDRMPLSDKRESYALLLDGTQASDAVNRDFFSGITLWPGSEARRKLTAVNHRELEKQRQLAMRQRNFLAISETALNDPRTAAQMISQLDKITAGMSDERAAAQLLKLADDYRGQSSWELAEATWIETVTRYPNSAASVEAMQRLFHLWAGIETAWHRARKVAVQRDSLIADLSSATTRLQKAAVMAQLPPAYRNISDFDLGPDPSQFATAPENNARDHNVQRRAKGLRHWQDQALQMATVIRKRDPDLYLSADMQFGMAALLRTRGAYRPAERFYQRYQMKRSDAVWNAAAIAELWMLAPRGESPKTMTLCKRAAIRPTLDGVLSDAVWETAAVVRLTPSKESGSELQQTSFLMFAYDADYLYVAGSVPQVISPPGADAKTKDRVRDADLSPFDRVQLHFDVDRDYATYYTLAVDQRGWTRESCWGDRSWNPKWFVAADRDAKFWRFEAAIPLKELSPIASGRGQVWAMGLTRITPAVGVQSWTHPVTKKPRPENFGLLRFE